MTDLNIRKILRERQPDPARDARDRSLVIAYQAGYLQRTLRISRKLALELISRYGVDRRALMKGVREELGVAGRKSRTRRPRVGSQPL